MSRFKPGQEVACLYEKEGWVDADTGRQLPGPDKHEVVTVIGYHCDGYVELREYHSFDGYDEECFEPLVSDSVLARELESVPEPFTISK